MNVNTNTVLGCVFILVSGLIFTLERLRSAIIFIGENVSEGSSQAHPFSPSIADNLVSIVFLLISLVFFYKAIRKDT